jgi:hypothetical protein
MGVNAPQILFLYKNSFLVTEWKRKKFKKKYFIDVYLCGVKRERERMKNLRPDGSFPSL